MRIRQTIDPNGKDRSVIEAFMRNVNTPREPTKAEAQSDNGRRYIALKDTTASWPTARRARGAASLSANPVVIA